MIKILWSKPVLYVIALFIAVNLIIYIPIVVAKTHLNPNTVVELTIENDQLVEPSSPIEVPFGKTVTFLIKTDRDNEFHLEGYHAFAKITAGKTNKLTFQALTPGTFPFLLERPHTQLGYLEVLEDNTSEDTTESE